MSTINTTPKTRTITLTGRPPVKIREDQWPIIAQGSYAWWDNQYRSQANRSVDIWLRVRQHADGRAIVYGGYDYMTCWQGEQGRDVRVGALLEPGADLVRAIQQVGAELADRIEDEPGAQRVRDVIDACIADLPAEEL